MTNFHDLKDRPGEFLSLTGYELKEFNQLLPHFSHCFLEHMQTHTLDNKPRKKRRYKPYNNSRFTCHEDMLLFILIYLRDAPKQVLFGQLFGMSQPLANKWIHFLLPILNKALAKLEALPSRETEPASMSDTNESDTNESDTNESQEEEHFFFKMGQNV